MKEFAYVVIYTDEEPPEILGVFSTEEKALNYIKSKGYPRDFDLETFQIDELELTEHLSGDEGNKNPEKP